MTVALLIVNWNGGDLLRRCLQSVREQRRPPDHVIVIDNASTDDSLARAEPLLPAVEVIKLDANTGFAHANNVGARRTRSTPSPR
jgi:GT2 family glycosyltransferase